MPRHIHLEPRLTNDDLEACYRSSHDPVERTHWHFLWLLARGLTSKLIASITSCPVDQNALTRHALSISASLPCYNHVQLQSHA